MKIDFSKKTVIVTGGTRGIGASIVEYFQNCNAEIISTGTNTKELSRLNRESKEGKTNYIHLDFTSNVSVKKFLDYIVKQDRIDVLVNNAGVNKIDSIQDVAENDWDRINDINLRGPFLLTKNIANIMMKQGYGRIVNITSIFGVVSKARRTTYSTTKWGMVGFTKAVALDLAPHNILVNAVSPGIVDTQLTREVLGEKGIKKIKRFIPQQRLADAHEIAKIVLFLSSEHNTYITGQNIIVDGGYTSA